MKNESTQPQPAPATLTGHTPSVIRGVRKALMNESAGNSRCTMTDLDFAVGMLDELIRIKSASAPTLHAENQSLRTTQATQAQLIAELEEMLTQLCNAAEWPTPKANLLAIAADARALLARSAHPIQAHNTSARAAEPTGKRVEL